MDCAALKEAHFASLPSQSNIYGLTVLTTSKTTKKVLIASLKRRVFCLEYTRNKSNDLIPSAREVPFTYIPGSAEIISIDAFNKSQRDQDFQVLVGITLIKDVENKCGIYLNIYSDFEPREECDLDHIAQGCQMLELDFIPYQLTHSELKTVNGKEIVWLLSGSDCKVHVYREDPLMQCYNEQQGMEYFPEFDNISSIVYWMTIVALKTERITAFGCEDGYIRVSVVDSETNKVLKKCDIQHDSIISCLKLFKDNYFMETPSFINFEKKDDINNETKDSTEVWHLFVGSTLEKAVVYRNILRHGFSNQHILPDSDKYDCVTAGCIMDIDMDGENEIVLGMYGQHLLAYKWVETSKLYYILWKRSFAHPLLSISFTDIIGDSVDELLVLSTKGVHILQYDPEQVAKLYLNRLRLMAKMIEND